MIKINVITNNNNWLNYIKKPNFYLDNKIKKLNSKTKEFKKNKIFCTILLSGSKEIKHLNKKFRKKNKSTDVLSFPTKNFNNNTYIGDIAICYEIINKRSKLSNFFLEFDKMWIHGYLHLIGYDHKRLYDFRKMLKREKLILKHFHKLS